MVLNRCLFRTTVWLFWPLKSACQWTWVIEPYGFCSSLPGLGACPLPTTETCGTTTSRPSPEHRQWKESGEIRRGWIHPFTKLLKLRQYWVCLKLHPPISTHTNLTPITKSVIAYSNWKKVLPNPTCLIRDARPVPSKNSFSPFIHLPYMCLLVSYIPISLTTLWFTPQAHTSIGLSPISWIKHPDDWKWVILIM